jgi:uncharacterized membrane protein
VENQELPLIFTLSVSLWRRNMWVKGILSNIMGICVCEKMTLFMGISVIFTFEASDLFRILFKKKTA